MSIRDPQHNYVIELVGVVEFNTPRSLNWLQQNISSVCEWEILIGDPNYWVQNFEYIMEKNNQIYYNEINDGPFNNY
jgi:hypothetical protein